MQKSKSGIYKITNIVNNKIYIGSATNINSRWSSHRRYLKLGKHHNIHLQRSYIKYGLENFTFEIIEECLVELLIEKEQFYLDHLNPEYNINPIANSQRGRVVSEETRKKMSIAQIGRKHSEETKYKISKGQHSKIIRKGKDHPNYGKKFSDELKQKLKDAWIKRKKKK